MAKAIKVEEQIETPREEFEKVEVRGGGINLKFKFNKNHAAILLTVILVMLFPTIYFYQQYSSTKNLLNNPKEQTAAQAKSLVELVGKLIELPTTESPKIATVSDVSQLVGQPFFAHAKNGDKVLIFTQAGKAILFRESENKIIEVSPVNTATGNTNTQVQTSTASPTPTTNPVSVVVLNGTATAGLAKSVQSKIQSGMPSVTATTADAVNGNYASTIVIDLSGKNADAAGNIAKLLNGKVQTEIPNGENKPNSDILIIIGQDYSK